MKKIQQILFTLVLLVSTQVFGQQQVKPKIQGVAVNSGSPVAGAQIKLFVGQDTTSIKRSLTNEKGFFEIEAPKTGKYRVVIEAFAMEKFESSLIELMESNSSYDFKTIELTPIKKDLGNVTVTSKKPLVEQKIDRTIVNVEAAVTNAGNNVLEVLEKSPGITVDREGNISLKGKSGVIVMVDGKPTQLGAADLANLLRNMNASQVDQIEIMTNPPAKYDAAGNAGIINLKTKKTKMTGFNGSVTAGYAQGVYPKTNQSVVANYRVGKINVFGNYSYNYRERFQQLDLERNFIHSITKELLSTFGQETRMQDQRHSHNGRIGVDYFASKKTTWGILLSGFDNRTSMDVWSGTSIKDKFGALQRTTISNTEVRDRWKNGSVNLNFRRILDSTGKEITADVDYIGYRSTNRTALANQFYFANGSSAGPDDLLLGDMPTLIDIYTAKVDYVQPLKKGAKFEAGAKFSWVETDNNAKFDSVLNNGIVPDYNRSNHFIYREAIQAAYINYSGQLSPKWSMQLGLRLERTEAKGDQLGNAQRPASGFDTSYAQLFPTAYLSYKISDKQSLVLNYGRRLKRPDYQDLNPFVYFLDRYTYQQGNPGLRPQFSHNVELSHMILGGAITTTLNYSKVNNIIQQVIEQNAATNETFIKQANIAELDQIGIAVSGQIPVTKWMNLSLYTNYYQNRFRGFVNQTWIDFTQPTLVFNGSSSIKFGKGWTGEVSGFYRSAAVEGVIFIQSLGAMNLGLAKSVLKSKGTVRLSVRDVFWTQLPNGSAKYDDVDIRFRQRSDSRVVNISFTYRFSKGKASSGPSRRKSNEEAERVKIGNN